MAKEKIETKKQEKVEKKTEVKKENVKMEKKDKENNVMRKIKIEKVVLGMGGKGEVVEKGAKLLNIISKKKAAIIKSTKRLPAFNVRPGLEVGCVVTLRGNGKEEFLKRMLTAIDNKLKRKQIANNHFSFGIKEYIEIPGMEYQRDIGMMGLDVTVVFARAGKRVTRKKVKKGKLPLKQIVSKAEIIKFMEDKFQTKFRGK